MPQVRVEPYQKVIFKHRPDAVGTMYMKYWGAVGDFYYLLTFVSPFLRDKVKYRRVLAADVYPRYGGHPVRELSRVNGLIDEFWVHSREGSGPTLVPPEYLHQATTPQPTIELYMPGIYYDKYLTGPGVLEFPIEDLRRRMREEPRYLIPILEVGEVREKFPQLRLPYVTYQHWTLCKRKRNIVPEGVLAELSKIGVQLVVMVFPSDLKRLDFFQQNLGSLPNVELVLVRGPVDGLRIQAHAACHVGVESSQLLGAVIHDVPALFFPFGGYTHFERDLQVEEMWTVLDWDVSPREVARLVGEVVGVPFSG